MIRFEELQMKIMDASKNYLEVFDMSTLIEQYTLNKESRLSMTLPDLRAPYPFLATVTFSYDAQQTSYSLIDEDEEGSESLSEMVEIDINISLPFLEGYNNISELFEEISNTYPDIDAVLVKKEFFRKDGINGEEYEILYSYILDNEEIKDEQTYEDIFFELSNILRTIYEKTKFYIEMSWYTENEDDRF